MTHPIFVYGTLRTDGSHHHLLKDYISQSQFASIRGKLYHYATQGDLGWYPYVTKGEGIVYGEILRCEEPERVLEITDNFEDNGILYRRELYPCITADGDRVIAWVYFIIKGMEKPGKRIYHGDWITEKVNGQTLSSEPMDNPLE